MRQGLLGIALCAVLIFQLINAGIVFSQGIDINVKAPDFQLSDLDGNKVSLKDFQGKVVALFFWATWCPYCRKEVAKLIKLNQEFSDKGLVILAIDAMESASKLKQFAQKNNINYMILIDKTGDVFDVYGIPGVPVIAFLDKKGIVKYMEFGLPEDYKQILERLLSEQTEGKRT